MENTQTKENNGKKKVIIAVVLLLLIALVAVLTSATTTEEPKVLDVDQTEGEVITTDSEEIEEEVEEETTSNTKPSNNGAFVEPADVANKDAAVSHNEVSAVEEHINLEMTVGKLNPTVNTYSDSAFGGVTVKANGKDVTKTCSVNYDSSKVGKVSGQYVVTITANCGSNGTVARQAAITLYIPAADEKPVAKDTKDTTPATPAPETKIVKDENGNDTRDASGAQEMTKIIIVDENGVETTFVKTEVENIYATQITKIFHISELPANYRINGNTLTVAGRTFLAA